MEVIGIIFSVMGTLLGGGPFGILILVVILYFFWMTLRYIWIAFTTGSTRKAREASGKSYFSIMKTAWQVIIKIGLFMFAMYLIVSWIGPPR